MRNRFLEGNDIGGQSIEAGLPNIKGQYNAPMSALSFCTAGTYSGAFTVGTQLGPTFQNQWYNAGGYVSFIFDASRSNPIYGRSDTVQPPSVTVRYYIRAK